MAKNKTKERQAYLDGFTDGYINGFQWIPIDPELQKEMNILDKARLRRKQRRKDVNARVLTVYHDALETRNKSDREEL